MARVGAAGRGSRVPGGLAVAGIGCSVLIMIAVSVAGPSRAVVHMPRPAVGPPWWLPLHPAESPVTVALWAAGLAGTGGVVAGLVAIRRGARPPARLLVVAALAVTAVLAVLPPAGSTDTLDYAAYGRMIVIGRNPYTMTPQQLRLTGDPVGAVAPASWEHRHSVYGPLATAEEAAAAELGGGSAARITFWLKLWNALAFAAVVLALDRLLRADPERRARAHLIWSLNPLLLWGLVAGGHVDTLAAAVGFLGLLLIGRPVARVSLLRAVAAGALVGAAADIKISFILYGLGIAWAARRSMRTLAAVAGGMLLILAPSYLWFGKPAVKVLLQRDASATSDNFYQLLTRWFGLGRPADLPLIALPLLVAVGALLLARLPDGFPDRPAVRPALALSLAWLLVWPYQRPWYDAMAFCLLALYPLSRLDWPMLARLAAATIYYQPGIPGRLHHWFRRAADDQQHVLVPVVRLAALVTVVVLCLTGAWNMRRRAGPGRPVSARTTAASPAAPAAHAPADAPPAPGNELPGRPGVRQPDPG